MSYTDELVYRRPSLTAYDSGDDSSDLAHTLKEGYVSHTVCKRVTDRFNQDNARPFEGLFDMVVVERKR